VKNWTWIAVSAGILAVGLAGGYFMSKRGSGEWDLIPATQLRAYSDVYYPAYLINRSTGEVVLIGLLEGQRFYRIYSNPNKGKFGDPATDATRLIAAESRAKYGSKHRK